MERPEFDRLLTATLPDIEQAAQRYSRKYHRAQDWQDIMQSAVLKMLRFADQYNPAKGDLLPWACVIIINTIKTLITQSMAETFMEDINAAPPAITFLNPEEELQTAFILAHLSRETRLWLEGYNYYEIAARCGVKSQVTAMSRIDKCVKRLSLILGRNYSRTRRQRQYTKRPD